ncbi:unnamed protein product [Ectocarpus sp. 4 AP-2014]
MVQLGLRSTIPSLFLSLCCTFTTVRTILGSVRRDAPTPPLSLRYLVVCRPLSPSSLLLWPQFNVPNGASLSKKVLLERVKRLKSELALLKEIREDGEARLKAQELDFARRNREIEAQKEENERQLQMNDKALGDAALGVRTRDRQIINLGGKICRGRMAMQQLQKNKHQVVDVAKREAREEINAERQQQQQQQQQKMKQQPSQGMQIKSIGHGSGGAGPHFTRASTGGGMGANPVRVFKAPGGGRAGK